VRSAVEVSAIDVFAAGIKHVREEQSLMVAADLVEDEEFVVPCDSGLDEGPHQPLISFPGGFNLARGDGNTDVELVHLFP
jgi:hypothetical protein